MKALQGVAAAAAAAVGEGRGRTELLIHVEGKTKAFAWGLPPKCDIIDTRLRKINIFRSPASGTS